jgi:hypothetical protein
MSEDDPPLCGDTLVEVEEGQALNKQTYLISKPCSILGGGKGWKEILGMWGRGGEGQLHGEDSIWAKTWRSEEGHPTTSCGSRLESFWVAPASGELKYFKGSYRDHDK